VIIYSLFESNTVASNFKRLIVQFLSMKKVMKKIIFGLFSLKSEFPQQLPFVQSSTA